MRTGYWVYWADDEKYEKSFGLECFADIKEVEEFINERPNWSYTVIYGTEHEVKTVTTTKLKIGE